MQDRKELQAELQRLVETLHARFPDAVIATRVAHADERTVVAHASVVTGDGPAGSGLGSAPSDDGAAELAENRAILRALIALGIQIPADEPARLTGPTAVDPPGRVVQFPTHEPAHEPESPPARDEPPTPPARTPRPEATAPPARPSRPEPSDPPRSVAPQPTQAPAAPSTSTSPTPPAAAAGDDEQEAADLSWTAFWKWAREHNYSNKLALEEALNGTINGRSPAEVRQIMREQLNIS